MDSSSAAVAFDTEERTDFDESVTAVLNRNERGTWPPQLRYLALGILAETGSPRTASRETGIPLNTITRWATTDDDAIRFMEELRVAVRTQTAHKLCAGAVKAVDLTIAALDRGDAHVDARGNVRYLPIKGKDAAFIASIFIDKHALVTGALVGQKAATQLHGLANMLAKLMGQTKGLAPSVSAPTPDNDGPVIG